MKWKKYLTRARRAADFDGELEAHLAHEADNFVASGMTAEAARHAPRYAAKIGNVAALLRNRSYRSRNRFNFLYGGCLAGDFRVTLWCQLRLSPGYAAVADPYRLALGTGVPTWLSFNSSTRFVSCALPVREPRGVGGADSDLNRRTRTGSFTGWPSEFTLPCVGADPRQAARFSSGMLAWSMDQVRTLSPFGPGSLRRSRACG